MASLETALACDPGDPYAKYNLARLLHPSGERARAEELLRAALESKPDFPEAAVLLASACEERGALPEAAALLEGALRQRPGFAGAWYNYALLLLRLERLADARAALSRLLELEPDFAAAHARLGLVCHDEERHAEALQSLRKALALDPGSAVIRWSFAMSQLRAVYGSEAEAARCRAAFAEELAALDAWFDAARAAEGAAALGDQTPFYLAYHESDNRELRARHGALCVRIMRAAEQKEAAPRPPARARDSRLRVGVVSAQFCYHSVWNAIVRGWFERLDSSRIELVAFHLGEVHDQETGIAASRAARFVSGRRAWREWAAAIQGESPDVLIYPEVGMDGMTLRLASLRLAPVQAASWGHPETTGLPTIDYFLSAEDLEPADAQAHYTERLVCLPRLGCYYPAGADAGKPIDLAALGLAARRPILVSPGAPPKYTPRYDAVLVEIARRLGSCRLVFFTRPGSAQSLYVRARLEAAFAAAGLAPGDYLAFIPWQNSAEFHALLRQADLYLDTLGFSGFNTAMEAVRCALPVVTREGRFLRGRLASGILKRMRMPELVAATEEEYVSLAVELARDARRRDAVRQRLIAQRAVLFEDLAPIRALEEFLLERSRSATSADRRSPGPA